MGEATKKYSASFLKKWIISIAVTAVLFLLPETEFFTYEVKGFLAITTLAMLMMAMELAHNIVPALLLQIGYYLLKVAPMETVFRMAKPDSLAGAGFLYHCRHYGANGLK